MATKLKGVIKIPKDSYRGCGEAILFLKKDDQTVCDKIVYLEESEDFEIESDDFHHPIKVMMSCWQAVLPSLKIHYDLEEL